MRQLYDIKTAAGLLCISPWTLRSYIAKGKVRPVRIGRRVLLQEEELERLVQRGTDEMTGLRCTGALSKSPTNYNPETKGDLQNAVS